MLEYINLFNMKAYVKFAIEITLRVIEILLMYYGENPIFNYI